MLLPLLLHKNPLTSTHKQKMHLRKMHIETKVESKKKKRKSIRANCN